MKNPKAKIIVALLSISSIAAVSGSIAGTLAWYQYSTRASAAFIGQNVKCTENLRIRIYDASLPAYVDAPWSTDLLSAMVNDYLSAKKVGNVSMASTFSPVTALSGSHGTYTGLAKDQPISRMVGHPAYQYFPYESWEDASIGDYVVLPLQFKLVDVDGTDSGVLPNKDIYLADVDFGMEAANSHGDLSDALRVHIHSEAIDLLLSKNGETIATNGYLDLDGDRRDDRSDGYEWDSPSPSIYGKGEQSSYSVTSAYGINNPLADDTRVQLESLDTALSLGKTDDSGLLSLTATIFLEGWEPFAGEDSYFSSLATLSSIQAEEGSLYFDARENKPYVRKGNGFEIVPSYSDGIPLYFDASDRSFHVYETDHYETVDPTLVSSVAYYAELNRLLTPETGDRYKNNADGKVYVYDGGDFVLDDDASSIWDSSAYIGCRFHVGLRFVVDAI